MAKMEILFTKSKNNDVFARVKAFKLFEHVVPCVPLVVWDNPKRHSTEYQLLNLNKRDALGHPYSLYNIHKYLIIK
jgi:hypothetical protein